MQNKLNYYRLIGLVVALIVLVIAFLSIAQSKKKLIETPTFNNEKDTIKTYAPKLIKVSPKNTNNLSVIEHSYITLVFVYDTNIKQSEFTVETTPKITFEKRIRNNIVTLIINSDQLEINKEYTIATNLGNNEKLVIKELLSPDVPAPLTIDGKYPGIPRK